jgi:predicted amidohydrolase YtcJ
LNPAGRVEANAPQSSPSSHEQWGERFAEVRSPMPDIAKTHSVEEKAMTVYRARKIITMDPAQPTAHAVAVKDGRLVAVGSFDDVVRALGTIDYTVDGTFADSVLIAGLIDQHLHPVLGASTLTTEVIAPEDWILPHRIHRAANTPEEYNERLQQASARLAEQGEPDDAWLFSWGFHKLWHGELDRARIDAMVGDRPTAIWQRSCHEWYLNSAAISVLGITAEKMAGKGAASEQVDVARGHFWENGWMVLLSNYLMPKFLTEARFREGLAQLVEYLHMNGVTAINEPGISWKVEPWHLYQEILGADSVPFTTTFLVDGRTQSARGMDLATVIDDANAQVARAPEGKVSLVAKQVKLFADGAIISQLMQMRDGYLDADGNPDPEHHGEWIMEPAELRRFFDVYWEAGWQIHIHVNGDLGLDVLLDIIADAMARHPRIDHRTTIVHFANSTEEQIVRIAKLGAIVSANAYYPVGFADKYSEFGLGPERADSMVRAASVLAQNIPLSFHSDLPMCAPDPLAMASYAVNRITHTGRVAGPEQRISVHEALRAVTIGAAFSWRREHDLGSIEVGKIANLTVLAEDPYERSSEELAHTRVLGTLFEGRWFPVPVENQNTRLTAQILAPTALSEPSEMHSALDHGCGCEVANFLGDHLTQHGFAA